MKDGVLHSDKSPAIEYKNWSIYALNGVKVPDWLVFTKDTEINPRKLLEIENAEIRREFVRKVGIDRVCYSLKAKVLDRSGKYELLTLDIFGRQRPYLKMLNPSIGTWHVEGVHPDCKTVQEAINYRRFGTPNPKINWNPSVLT